MKPAVVARQARNLLSMVEIAANRALGREIIVYEHDLMTIEPTSTCNLKCSFCAYEKKTSPKLSMKHDRFVAYVEQAVAMGYRRFHLTPSTGDIFMDRHIFQKLLFLEDHPGVHEYFFFTNLTVLDAEGIERLATLKKLTHVYISVYGHDRETFVKIAKSTNKVYQRLLANLETVLDVAKRRRGLFEAFIRSTRDMPRTATSDLLKLLERFKQNGIRVKRSKLYHNFGGYVTQEDQRGLAIDVIDSKDIYKQGACAFLFSGVQIMATGIVHACSCVDPNATLKIGDLNEKPLWEIVSTKNPLYMNLIEQQQRGEFEPVCQSCALYKSIYHARMVYRKSPLPRVSIEGFKTALDAKVDAGEQSAGKAAESARPHIVGLV